MSAASVIQFPASETAYRAEHRAPLARRLAIKTLSAFTHHLLGWKLRGPLYRAMGVHLDQEAFVGRESYLDPEFPELITIERGATVSARVIIACHDSSRNLVAPVRICADAFIGTGAIILPGVTVGEGAVVGAGAVATRDVPPGMLAVGSPARVVGERKRR